MIRVMIAEDQGMMRDALALLLGLEDDLEIVAQVAAGDEIVAAATEHRPDVALLDIELPGRSGLDVLPELRAALPECAVLILTTFARPGYLRRAMEAGAAGFLVKDGPVEELAAAIRRARRGGADHRPGAGRRRAAAPGPARSPTGSGTCWPPRSTAPRSPTSRPGCTCRRARYATTCRPPSARPNTRNRIEAAQLARHNGWL